ncbi:hypothetical protein [Spirosoma fluminis]
MLASVLNCETVLDMNAARRDLINQLYKRGITLEEFDTGYEHLFRHAYSLGLRWHVEYRSYGPIKIDGLRGLLNNIKYARSIRQINQAYEQIQNHLVSAQMGQAQYDMCWTLLLAQADFQGYTWNQLKQLFYES